MNRIRLGVTFFIAIRCENDAKENNVNFVIIKLEVDKNHPPSFTNISPSKDTNTDVRHMYQFLLKILY